MKQQVSSWIVRAAVAFCLSVGTAQAGEPPAGFAEHRGQWELAYGLVYYRVFGDVQNTSKQPIPWAKVQMQLVDAAGKVLLDRTTFNAEAEILNDLSGEALAAAQKRVEAMAPGAKDLFRVGITKDELPKFHSYRIRVLEPVEGAWVNGAAPLPNGTKSPVDVNAADKAALLKLPEMTDARAKAILNYRRGNGAFIHLEELPLIPQIAPISEKLLPHLAIH